MAVGDQELPEQFRDALRSLRAWLPQPGIEVTEAPSPRRLAPHTHALTASVSDGGDELATGQLVLLHDPARQELWQGPFRLVTFVSAPFETEIAVDPLLPAVAWSWLVEALETQGAVPTLLSGTVTTLTSTGFGAKAGPVTASIELRASWSPQVAPARERAHLVGAASPEPSPGAASAARPAPTPAAAASLDLHPHLGAWCALLASVAGLPPADCAAAAGGDPGGAPDDAPEGAPGRAAIH